MKKFLALFVLPLIVLPATAQQRTDPEFKLHYSFDDSGWLTSYREVEILVSGWILQKA